MQHWMLLRSLFLWTLPFVWTQHSSSTAAVTAFSSWSTPAVAVRKTTTRSSSQQQQQQHHQTLQVRPNHHNHNEDANYNGNTNSKHDMNVMRRMEEDYHPKSELSGAATNDDNETDRMARRMVGMVSLLSTMAIIIILTTPMEAAVAIDHPVDHVGLGIPSPLLPPIDNRYFLSGGLCAATSHGITTPIDVIKTRIQANPESLGKLNFMEATRRILSGSSEEKEEGDENGGWSILLGGLGPTVVGYGLEGAAKFGLYETLKPVFSSLLFVSTTTTTTTATVVSTSSTVLPYLMASVVAGAAASLLLCPMERTRIRLVTDPNFSSDGLFNGLQRIVQEEGLSQLFSGLPAMLSKQVPYTITKQVTFDMFAGLLYTAAASASLVESDIKVEVSILAAFLASIGSCITSHPGDVVLTATYQSSSSYDDDNSNNNLASVVSTIYKRGGIRAFFTGISARFLHVGIIITSQLVLYDFIKQSLGLPATGSH